MKANQSHFIVMGICLLMGTSINTPAQSPTAPISDELNKAFERARARREADRARQREEYEAEKARRDARREAEAERAAAADAAAAQRNHELELERLRMQPQPPLKEASTMAVPETPPAKPQRMPQGVYRGTVIFSAYKKKLVSSRVLRIGESQTNISLTSRDHFETNPSRKYDSEINIEGFLAGNVFHSKSQKQISTDYNEWISEEMRLEFAPDGRSIIGTSTFRDSGGVVVGKAIFVRE
jgi:hypothetical protein